MLEYCARDGDGTKQQLVLRLPKSMFYVCVLSKVHWANLLLVYVKRIGHAHATVSERRSEIVFGYCQFMQLVVSHQAICQSIKVAEYSVGFG